MDEGSVAGAGERGAPSDTGNTLRPADRQRPSVERPPPQRLDIARVRPREHVGRTGVAATRYTQRPMADTTTLLEQALSLPEHERAKIAARLLESLDEEAQSDVDAAWAAEIERRCAAVDAGTLATSDWKDVRERIEREIFGR